MPSWWGRSSSKEVKKKTKETFIDSIHRKLKSPSDDKEHARSYRLQRRNNDTVGEKHTHLESELRSQLSSGQVSRCQSFCERPHAQPLPLPSIVDRAASEISALRPGLQQCGQQLLYLPLPKPDCVTAQADAQDADGYLATASISSETSVDSDDPVDSRPLSPHANGTVTNSPTSVMHKDRSPVMGTKNSKEQMKPVVIFDSQSHLSSPKRVPSQYPPSIRIPQRNVFFISSAPDSSMSSPSRSPKRVVYPEQITNSSLWGSKPYPDISLLGSGQCSSPGSGHNSGHNSVGGDLSGQLFWQHSRGSPECSPIPSPRMSSPGTCSRIHSGAVTPLHPRAGGAEPTASWPDDGKQQSHRLPLPPIIISGSSALSPSHSATVTPLSVPRSPGRAENNPASPGSRWKKGKLIGRGTFGHVYVGFNSESGEMCAMKEVTLFSEDAKSKESAKQLMQEIALLSRLRHQNIVQYLGSETVDDKLYIYLEYVSGGSIHKLLQEYGQFGELAIRNYTKQILSGLAYLHAKTTVHRDIKGANILVDPNGRVKLADFGMAKHITGQSCPLSFKGSPYWMAPEVIKNSNGCNLAVDIWSLGCTVIEMATTKPPWSQYEGVAAMFKIGNSKDLPSIPDHLSDEGKDFIRLCLQRNPALRPSAAQLLDHPFVKNVSTIEKPIQVSENVELPAGFSSGYRSPGPGSFSNLSSVDTGSTIHYFKGKAHAPSSGSSVMRNISCPVSPIGSPLLHSRSPQHVNGRMSPSPISSPRTVSGSSTPLTGANGALPFSRTLQQSPYLHEGFTGTGWSLNNQHANGLIYHDINHDFVQPHAFRELLTSENVIKVHAERPAHAELHDWKSVMPDSVYQQILRDPMSLNASHESDDKTACLGWQNLV